MASPQTQNGYAKLANELVEALYRFDFSGCELRVLVWVIRQSYGWRRKDTFKTSVRAIAVDTRLPPATVGWALKGLSTRGVLLRMEQSGGLRLNKNYDEWLPRGSSSLGLFADTKAKRKAATDTPAPRKKERKVFVPPTLEEVRDYCSGRKSVVDPARFFNHYEATGWRSGPHQKQVTNWKSLVCYWERTSHEHGAKAATWGPCPLCDGPREAETQICCNSCKAYCRVCGREGGELRIFKRPDNTNSLRCKVKCHGDAGGDVAKLARTAVPEATRKLEAERRERFMAAQRVRRQAKERT